MIDRYTISISPENISSIWGSRMPKEYQPSYNAGPTQKLPIITIHNPKTISLSHWGLIANLSNNKKLSPRQFNLPAQSYFEKPMYQKNLLTNRCVILSDGFYQWKQTGKKQQVPYYFYFPGRTAFGMAGMTEAYEDIDGNRIESFTLLTTPAAGFLREFQEDMPVILSQDLFKSWLDTYTAASVLQQIMTDFPTHELRSHAVSPLISDLSLNSDNLIQPSTPSDQFGNYTLFT